MNVGGIGWSGFIMENKLSEIIVRRDYYEKRQS